MPTSRHIDRRGFLGSALSSLAGASACAPVVGHELQLGGRVEALRPRAHTERSLAVMKQAVRFMTEKVAYRGGYLWAYLPDFSRCWGELEARRSMLWVQPPGTPSVGHVFLDAYNATGDELYLAAAGSVARALVTAQQPSGGWNYVYDFAGPESLADWYSTIGRNAWRLEEFHKDPGNSTFDDACTSTAGQFLLRMAVEHPAAEWQGALERVLALVEVSQYDGGGWPQRYPLGSDYTRAITFNDDVIGENIELCLLAYLVLGDAKYWTIARAAMDSVLHEQQPEPQPGWGLQHSLDGTPCAARSFEPAALASHTTAKNVERLMNFYELGRDWKYMQRVPAALDWLDRIALPRALAAELGGTHPTFIEPGTGTALYVHRRGSNVFNGEYYTTRDPRPVLAHYSPVRTLNVTALRRRYAALLATRAPGPVSDLGGAPNAAPRLERHALPRYFCAADIDLARSYRGAPAPKLEVSDAEAERVLDGLSSNGAWLTPLEFTSNAYLGNAAKEPVMKAPYLKDDYVSTFVGDRTDTSPYRAATAPRTYGLESAPLGISVAVFIRNMVTLIRYVSG